MKKRVPLWLVVMCIGLVIWMFWLLNRPSYVELTKEAFLQLDPSNVQEVYLASTDGGKSPDKWARKYTNVFPVSDPCKVAVIFQCMRDANSFDSYADRKIVFKCKNTIYYTDIGWDSERVYGKWWDSPKLLEYFKQLGFTLPAGEPNLPKGQILDHDPFDPNAPKFDINEIKRQDEQRLIK